MILGPTAVGKSSVALRLALRLEAEIVSADSRQCYRGVDIGTATPPPDHLRAAPHYNISILEPDERDSAANFCERAREWTREINGRGKPVIYAGGSTLHLQCLIQPLDDVPPTDRENRRRLQERMAEEGLEVLYRQLREVDPEYAEKMDGMNPQRIVRALDVWMQTGKAFSSFHTGRQRIVPPDDLAVFGLRREREELYDRINRRVDRMMERGLLDEVRSLLDAGYTSDDPGLNTVGYREPIAWLNGKIGEEEMVRRIKQRTRRYAKRQITWFRRWDFIRWIDAGGDTPEACAGAIEKRLAAMSNKD